MADKVNGRFHRQPFAAEAAGTALLLLVGLSAVISGQWDGWWIYWLGPLAGTLVALLAGNSLVKRIEVAKLYHFSSDRRGLFRRAARVGAAKG
jgi:hypothetical protein